MYIEWEADILAFYKFASIITCNHYNNQALVYFLK